MGRIALHAGALRVEVVPEVGGSIGRFDHVDAAGSRTPVLRGTDDDYHDVLDSSLFPLVPYANRICDGSFICNGRKIVLPLNLPGDASPLHGQGWRSVWRPASAPTGRSVELLYEHAVDAWPWRYEARLSIALDENGLTLRLVCRNLDAEPMPCGLGLHPYFPCSASTVLDTHVTSAWTIDEKVLPVAQVPANGRYDLRKRRICAQGLDNGFEGWSGCATMTWPESNLCVEMSSPDAARFQVYSPSSGGVFVAEPVQNANAALNRPQAQWADAGLRLLSRGEESVLTARFEVFQDGWQAF